MYLLETTDSNQGFLLTPRTGRQLSTGEVYISRGQESVYLVIESGSMGEI
jgi:hypothetical protein